MSDPRAESADENLERILKGSAVMYDFAISRDALLRQGCIAREAGRLPLAENFERASELVNVPDAEIFRIYDMLRPGRCHNKQELLKVAEKLRAEFNAHRIADFIIEAAEHYERRKLFTKRY